MSIRSPTIDQRFWGEEHDCLAVSGLSQANEHQNRHITKNVAVVPVSWLKPHEECLEERLCEVYEEIVTSNGFRRPIIVDSKTGVILDGHHRHRVSKSLSLTRIPAILVDYLEEPEINVIPWTHDLEDWSQPSTQPDLTSCSSGSLFQSDMKTKPAIRSSFPSSSTVSTCYTDLTASSHSEQIEDKVCTRSNTSSGNMPTEIMDYADDTLETPRSHLEDCAPAEIGGVPRCNDEKIAGWIPKLPRTKNIAGFNQSRTVSQDSSKTLTKELIIQIGLSQSVFSPKSTKHLVPAEWLEEIPLFSLSSLK